MDDQFFLVWNPNGMGPPRYRHGTKESAERESLRLADQNPGQTFHVLGNLGAASKPAAVFTPVDRHRLIDALDAQLGDVVAGSVTAPGPIAQALFNVGARFRGHSGIIGAADYIPGIKDKNSDPDADTKERAGAEVIRLRTWLHRILEATSGEGWVSPAQRVIIYKACSDALTCEPPPFPNQAKASLPGFDDAEEVPLAPAVEEKPARVLKHGEYQPGDRVRFTGRYFNALQELIGRTGRITNFIEIGVGIVLDGEHGVRLCSPENLEHESLPQFDVGDGIRTRSGDIGIIESLGATTASIMGSDGHGFTTHYSLLTLVCPVQRRGGGRW